MHAAVAVGLLMAMSVHVAKWSLGAALLGGLAALAYRRYARTLKRKVKASSAASSSATTATTWFTPFAASAPGKIILSGEHAVVHGALAVATTVERRTFAFFTPATDSDEQQRIEIEVDHPQHRHTVTLPIAPYQALVKSLGSALPDTTADTALLTPAVWEAVSKGVTALYPKPTADAHGAAVWESFVVVLVVWVTTLRARTGLRVVLQSELPMGAGLGSSASFSAAVATGFHRLRSHFAAADATAASGTTSAGLPSTLR